MLHDVESRIAFVTGDPGKFSIDELEIASPAGATMLQERKIEIAAGERVLIVGESGTGKTLLFRALAGLWPWGAVESPIPEAKNFFTCRAPPTSRPAPCAKFCLPIDHGQIRGGRLCQSAGSAQAGPSQSPMLDVSQRWDRELSEDEQQTLTFARVLLHSPPWVLIDEVLDSMDEDARQAVLDLFAEDLRHTGVIHIGRADAHDHLFSRVLHLVKDPALRRLQPAAAPLAV